MIKALKIACIILAWLIGLLIMAGCFKTYRRPK